MFVRRFRHTILILSLGMLGFAAQPLSAGVVGVHSSMELPNDGNVDWSNLGALYANVNSGTSVPVTGMSGSTLTVSNNGGSPFQVFKECDSSSTNCNWWGDFMPNTPLLWTGGGYDSAYAWTGNGPITLRFNSPQRGVGFQIMPDETGAFTANVCAYNSSNTLLKCVTFTGSASTNEDGSADFVGLYDDNLEISYITIDACGATYPHDFAIAKVQVGHNKRYLASETSSISSNFNRSLVGARNVVWFNSAVDLDGIGKTPVTVTLTKSTIQFTANGIPYTLNVPDATVIFSPTATTSTTSFDASSNSWPTTVPSSLKGNAFLDGLEFIVPGGGLPSSLDHVVWKGTFTTATPGISLRWKWGAAVYASFNTDYNALNVKPVDDNHTSVYHNSDPAGTPENFKPYVIPGATGNGGNDWTGKNNSSNTLDFHCDPDGDRDNDHR